MNNEIKINVPEGMEIDKEHSTFECIKFKPKWIPKRGDIAFVGSSQTILVESYLKEHNTIGFYVAPLAILTDNSLSIGDNCSGYLWVLREASPLEKKLFIEKLNEQGYVYDLNDPRIIYKKEEELPKTWEEFCQNNPVKNKDYYVNSFSDIRDANVEGIDRERDIIRDANLLPSKKYAEAMLSLCKLIQLRDCYNDRWKPDWKEESFKYVIRFYNGLVYFDTSSHFSGILAFKTKDLRDIFSNNFRDLIEQAKLLL